MAGRSVRYPRRCRLVDGATAHRPGAPLPAARGRPPSAPCLDPFSGRAPLNKGGLQGLSVATPSRLAGLSLANARLVPSAWGGLLLVAAFLAGRRLFGPAAGAVGAALLAASQ